MQNDMRIVNFTDLEYKPKGKALNGVSSQFGGSFPSKFGVRSDRTGKIVTFEMMKEGDPLLDPDFWDGEYAGYRPTEKCGIDVAFLGHGQ